MTLAIERSPGSVHRDANKAPCGAGEQQTNCTQREWCPVLRTTPCGCQWRPRRAETLTGLVHTPRQQKETLYDDFRTLDERKRKEASMRDLNYDLKQLSRHNRDGSYATQADREHILDLIADQ